MGVPLLDLKRQYMYIKDELDKAVLNVLNHGLFILGPEVTELEEKISAMSQTKFAVGVASGTDALLLALKSAGVGPGDEVITTDFSFFASASVISRVGATPVFVDIEEDTYNVNIKEIEKAVTHRTKAIIPVHLFGQCADMDPIMEIAGKHRLTVIEDAAQAIGATYKGRQAGSMGHYGCFSFYPSKNLGGAGDGGMVVTNDEKRRNDLGMLRVHGWKKKYRPEIVGYNSRLDSLQAAIVLAKADYLAEWTEMRIAHARRYDAAFSGTSIRTPAVRGYAYHIYNQYTIAVENQQALIKTLKEKQIGYDIYYPLPFHLLACYRDLPYREGDFPVSEKAIREVVSIPIFPELTEAEQEQVIEVVKSVSA